MSVEAETLKTYADRWGQENGYEVEVLHQSPSVQQFAQAVKSASGPDAVVGIPNDQLANFVNAGLAAEVPEELYRNEDFRRQPYRHAMWMARGMRHRSQWRPPRCFTIRSL